MKVVSYNVNGIRAALKKGLLEYVKSNDIDVLCLQEVKATRDQVDLSEFEALGYEIYWEAAEKKGYSGVATFTKVKPKKVVNGSGHDQYDAEGRFLRLDFDHVSIQNVYVPSGASKEERQKIKFEFLEFFLPFCKDLRKELGKVVVCGDYNIAHTEIDIHNPKSNKNSSGFLPEERAWIDKLLENGFVDSFRIFHAEPHHYSWWTYRAGAREKNKGWRIDYHMISEELKENLTNAYIQPDAKQSDHCPIVIELKN